ncbi:efflux RND transporter periplasmic adaptor subunit [Oleispirillum naphthae]|uniref:efflux RND transporter periplasmic adaptor subunit n=1 Tax=Oleispirillum naphthae TaxID=2838853 RepID=UPI0030823A9C
MSESAGQAWRAKLTWRRVAVAAAAVAVLAVGARMLWGGREPPPPTVAAALADIEDTVLADGTLQAARQVNVGAQVSGQIKAIQVNLGDAVSEGQPVVEIDSLTQQNALRNAEAALASVIAQRTAKLASLEQAELTFKRQSRLLKQDAGSREDYEAAVAGLKTLKAGVAVLDAEIEQAKVAVDTAKVNLGYTRISAPISGTVVAVAVDEGQTVNANQTTPTLLKLAQLDTMTVCAEVSEADIPRVAPGQTVYFTILGEPDNRYYTKVRAIEPASENFSNSCNASSGTASSTTTSTTSSSSSSSSSNTAIYYNALFDVPNPGRKLRIAMTAQVSIVLAEAKQAVTIPAAILGAPGRDGLYTVQVAKEDGSVEKRRVKVGINNHVTAQVVEGLAAGERVVSSRALAAAAAGSFKPRSPMGRLF